MTTPVSYQTDHRGITRITLDRPDVRNAFDDQVILELTAAFETAARDPECRVVVLAGAGKHFSAGADLNWMKGTAKLSPAANKEDARQLAKLMRTLDTLPKPTLVRIQGAAYGGALGLICACDIAIAADNARFCLSEVRLGIAPAAIGPSVIKAIGQRQARRYMQTAEEITAPRALDLGLVHEVVPETELDSWVDTLATRLLNNGPQGMAATKALIARTGNNQPDDALTDYTADVIAGLRTGEEGQEGLQAFFDKRKPSWAKG